MSSASLGNHISHQFTTLELNGGRPVNCLNSKLKPDLIVHGGASINLGLCVNGGLTSTDDLSVQGDLSIFGNATVIGDLIVGGNIVFDDIGKVKVNAADTPGYLDTKLVAGNLITLTTIPGEQIRIDGIQSDIWSFDGDNLPSVKYIGTNNNFDFPINTNGSEVARFTTDARLFMGAETALNGSNAGIQYSTLTANRAQFRGNQYGANTGVPGITTFKSRGTSIGINAPVQLGDVIYGATGIGVTQGNLIPLSFLSRAVVSSVGTSWIATDYEMSLVPLIGPTNGIRRVFGVSSEGMLRVRETVNSMAGIATLDAVGQFIVSNTNVNLTSRFTLTVQDNTGGVTVPPTGNIYVSARAVGSTFTITSTAGAADAGVIVYYQIWEQAT